MGCHSEHEGGKEGHDEQPKKKKKTHKILKNKNKHRKEIRYWELTVMLVVKVILKRMN